MLPIGLLMKEHRVIEKMVKIIKNELENIKKKDEVNDVFIDAAVDFFRTYADRTHHGKEEDILFRELENKDLSQEHQEIMDRLVDEHVYARETVTALYQAKEKYMDGKKEEIENIIENMRKLIDLYPPHIDTEDNHFFKPSMEYFSDEEIDDMLSEFNDFDRDMIHEKYNNVVKDWAKE